MLTFWPSDLVLIAVQAALVMAPQPVLARVLARLKGNAWAWILPVSLGATIAFLAVLPSAASAYTWLALVAIPVLAVPPAARVLGWPVAVVGAGALFALAWTVGGSLVGQGAAVALTALSCVTLAAYLAELASPTALRIGILAMAVLDSVLVFGQLLEGPNNALNAAAPGGGLPQLQVAVFGSALVGYGDLFVAAVLGAVLAREGVRRSAVAVLTFVLSGLFDLLFLVTDVLPATVPVAVAMLTCLVLPAAWLRAGPGRLGEPEPERASAGR